jgi:hypothetical protein
VSISPITRLAAAATAGAQSLVNYRIQLVGNQLTAQLNKKIAELKLQSEDPTIPVLQQQAANLTKQQTAYADAQGQLSGNGTGLADLSLQLASLATAAQGGNAAAFDQALTAAGADVGILQVVPYLAGFQPDGVAALKFNGLAIQPSATYNLGTPAGQAQALSDVQAAQSLVGQISSTTLQNQTVAASIGQTLQSQISAIGDLISQEQTSVLTDAATQIDKLKHQTQEQFHLIELAFGSVGNVANMLQGFQTANNIAPPPGSVVSLLVGQSGGPTLAVGQLTPVSPTVIPSSGR